jgi:hypothetical protein
MADKNFQVRYQKRDENSDACRKRIRIPVRPRPWLSRHTASLSPPEAAHRGSIFVLKQHLSELENPVCEQSDPGHVSSQCDS